ncbi:MAG TPA: LUD domain-containing protein [Gaiellaceae bacterium]|nr:LUD domain-containing protein [Gaiellaceae bacterium]
MSAAREEMLGRVRRALGNRGGEVDVPREYRCEAHGGSLDRFVERLHDYGAGVRFTDADGVAAAVAEACAARGVARIAVPVGFPEAWRPGGVEIIVDEGLAPGELEAIGAAATGAALGIAETGTIVLDAGEGQGRRILSLVPDVHVCVVRAGQVVDGVPAAMRALAEGFRTTRRPVTFISGPSATADIEFQRVEGVHGPRQFEVVLVSD